MKADTITKDFISDTSAFADVFNYYIYGGESVILPEQLKERDTVEIALPYGTLEYVLFGAEAQAEIQYAMPVKNNLYDVLDYAGQVEEAAKSHRKAMLERRKQKQAAEQAKELGDVSETPKAPTSGEFLSGFWKEDRLIPSLTVTIYFGCEEWDGPLSLFDMLEVKDPRILESGRERFQELERRAVDVIEVITGLGLKYDESEVKVDMCQAIVDMRAEERQKTAQRFYQMGLDIETISLGLNVSPEIVRQWIDSPADAARK